jgi:anaerobic magnesium-protoporphyrin IX monomethyl ester cyclase
VDADGNQYADSNAHAEQHAVGYTHGNVDANWDADGHARCHPVAYRNGNASRRHLFASPYQVGDAMHIVFVYPDIGGSERYGARKYYHGLGYLSSSLKAAGHQTSLVYLHAEPERDRLLGQVDHLAPDLVAFSSTTNQHPYVERCATWLKEARPDLPLVSGGTHPTLVPDEVISVGNLDFVCVGEGEGALVDLASALASGEDPVSIPNLWVRDREGGEIARNAPRPLVVDLDTLPHADRELFEFDRIMAGNGHVADVMAGRGCPYNCSYCCNHALKARYSGLGKYVRFRSPENVLAELDQLVERYEIKALNFQDDTFTLDHKWATAFCTAYAAEFSIPFWINTRVEHLDEVLIRTLAESGCQRVRIGVESGNEELRRTILGRRMSNDDFRATFRLLHDFGIETYTCNMLGIPGETPEMIQETIDLNRELAPERLQFSVFYPYPMTALADTCEREGYIRREGEALSGYYGRESILELPTLTADELAAGYARFEELERELYIKKHSAWRHRVYRLLYRLYGGDIARARRHLALPARWLRALHGGLRALRAGGRN